VTYQEALDFLYPLHRFGIKFGLDRVRNVLDHIGSPDKRLGLIIHIAGTNGKGTVAACLASIFQASGKKTALYTSPHLVDFTERIRINGAQIPRAKVAYYSSLLKDMVCSNNFTFFEATTAIAFAWFADENTEVAIIETGMGGRLDATNILDSTYAVISNIGLEHTEWLGSTLSLIASEKAAIIKKNSRVFTAVSMSDEFEPILKSVKSNNASLFVAGQDAVWSVLSAELGKLELDIRTSSRFYPALKVPLTGSFHGSNVTLAVMVAEDAGIAMEHIYKGLELLLHTGYRARLEKISTEPTILLDVSHNSHGIRETVNTIASFRNTYHRVYVIFGLASDKDFLTIIRELSRLDCTFIPVNIPSERSASAEALGVLCEKEGFKSIVFDTVRDALGYMRENAEMDDLIVITGSFYLAGAVIAAGN